MSGIDHQYRKNSLSGVHCAQVHNVVRLGLSNTKGPLVSGAQNLNEGPTPAPFVLCSSACWQLINY